MSQPPSELIRLADPDTENGLAQMLTILLQQNVEERPEATPGPSPVRAPLDSPHLLNDSTFGLGHEDPWSMKTRPSASNNKVHGP